VPQVSFTGKLASDIKIVALSYGNDKAKPTIYEQTLVRSVSFTVKGLSAPLSFREQTKD
jgi:hypothetical protein